MSHLSLIMDLANELSNYSNVFHDIDPMLEDDFGQSIHPMDIFRPRAHHSLMIPYRRRHSPYARSLLAAKRAPALRDGGKLTEEADSLKTLVPVIGKDGFQVCMDVSQFKPNELTVKTVENMVVIEGKHEEREDDHGMIQRHFIRKYTLPKDYDPKEVVSTVSSDGVLTVKAPPPPNKALKQNERIVQIQQTGPAHLSIKAPAELQQGDSSSQSQNGEKTSKAAKSK